MFACQIWFSICRLRTKGCHVIWLAASAFLSYADSKSKVSDFFQHCIWENNNQRQKKSFLHSAQIETLQQEESVLLVSFASL